MNGTISYAPSKTINEAVIENTHGAQAAFNATGSCAYHPDILLRKKTLTGFKILEKECPRCKIEWGDRRRAALARREASPSYLRLPHATSRPQLQMHSQHHTQNSLFQPQQPEPHPNSLYFRHESQPGHHQHHHHQPQMSPPSQFLVPQPQIAVPSYYHHPPAPARPVLTTCLSQQPLNSDIIVTPSPSHPATSTPTLLRPSMVPPRPWVSEPQLNHISDGEVEVEEADEESTEADVELDLITAFDDDDVETILEIMKDYRGSPAIQGLGCKALLKICNRCDDNARTVLYCGAKEVVAEAYKFFKDSDVNVAGDGFVLLELFKRLECLSDTIPEEPAPDYTPEPGKSSLTNLLPIDFLAESSAKPELNLAYQNDDIQSIVRIMGKFTKSSSLQEIGCRALWRLSHRYGKMEIVRKCGGCAVVEDAVHCFGKTNDEVGGYGRMILDLSNRTSSDGTTSPTEPATKIPFTSLPRVNSCIERIAVDDIRFFGRNSDPQRVGTMMSWYPGSGNIQGNGCKELWSILQNSETFDELLAPGPTQAIEDAVYYFAGINNYVDEYGTRLFDIMSMHKPDSYEVLPQVGKTSSPLIQPLSAVSEQREQPAMKDGTTVPASKVTVNEEMPVQPANVGEPNVPSQLPLSHNLEDDSRIMTDILTVLKVSQDAPFTDINDGACVPLISRVESDAVDDRPSIFDEPEFLYDPNDHKLSTVTILQGGLPQTSDNPTHELPFIQTGTAIASQLPPAFRTLIRSTKNMATNITVSLANGEKPSAPPLPRVLKMIRKSAGAIPQMRHPLSSSFTQMEPAEDLISSANTKAVPAVEYSRTLTSRNFASISSSDPALETTALNELRSIVSREDVNGLLELMRRHRGSRAIQGQGCLELWKLSNRPNKAAVAINSGGIDVIKNALFHFGKLIEDDIIFGYGTVLLDMYKSLSTDSAVNSQRRPTKSPETSQLDPQVESILADVLINFRELHDVDNTVLTMSRYLQSPRIQGLGCIALLAIAGDANAKTLVANHSGAKKVVQAAVQSHSGVDKNVTECGPALLNLLQNQTGMPNDAVHPLVVAKLSYPKLRTQESQQRVRPSLSSLRRTDPLVERIASNSLKSFDLEADVEKILSIMRRHPDSMAVQSQGVKKLWEFCFVFDKIDDVLGSSAKEIVEDATFYFGKVDSNVSEYAPMITNLFN